jgi:tRNA (cmo5U34)-methyltransferase
MSQNEERDEVFKDTNGRAFDFEFDDRVAKVFDDMLVRSVPFYVEQQRMIGEIARKFWVPGTQVYDLGCSTATTLIALARLLGEDAQLTGYDNSMPMIERAKQNIAGNGLEDRVRIRYGDLNGDLSDIALEKAGVVTMCWTLQFVRPLQRSRVVRWVYDNMVEDGVLVITEKTLTNNTHTNRFFIDFYHDFKRRNRYSEDEILRKREALENVLIPYRLDENLKMLGECGFEIVEPFVQWYNFAGFLCIKKPIAPRQA